MQIINDPDEIPAFASEAEEAEFWDTYSLAEHLLSREHTENDLLPPTRPASPASPASTSAPIWNGSSASACSSDSTL